MADQDASTLTDEELAKQHWEWLRERYMNLGTRWDQLAPAQREWCKAWVRQLRQQGHLPEYNPKA